MRFFAVGWWVTLGSSARTAFDPAMAALPSAAINSRRPIVAGIVSPDQTGPPAGSRQALKHG